MKKDLGQTFIDWVVSPAGQKAIADYKIGGEQLFFPNAGQAGRVKSRWGAPRPSFMSGAVSVPYFRSSISLGRHCFVKNGSSGL